MRRVILAALAMGLGGCGSGVRGTYSDQSGAFVLDLNGVNLEAVCHGPG